MEYTLSELISQQGACKSHPVKQKYSARGKTYTANIWLKSKKANLQITDNLTEQGCLFCVFWTRFWQLHCVFSSTWIGADTQLILPVIGDIANLFSRLQSPFISTCRSLISLTLLQPLSFTLQVEVLINADNPRMVWGGRDPPAPGQGHLPLCH